MATTTSPDGTRIDYDRTGAGPTVILIGSGPTDRNAHNELAALLAESCTVVNYDRRGRGSSGDTAPYHVQRELEDLRSVAEAVGGEVALFGNSGGAFLAFKAVAGGLRATRIAVWEPPYIVPGSRTAVPADYAEQQAELDAKGDRSGMAELFLGTAAAMPAEFLAGLKQGPYWGFLEAAASPALMYDAQLAGDFQIDRDVQAQLNCPVLVFDGGTTGWLTQAADAVAAVTPNATRQTLTGQQHNFEAKALAGPLSSFVNA